MVSLLFAALVVAAPADLSARAAFEQGTFLFKADRVEEALPYFEAAYEKSGHRASAIFALAQCERSLKLYDRAIEHLEEFIQVAPVKQAARARRTLKEVRQERDRAPPAGPSAATGDPKSSVRRMFGNTKRRSTETKADPRRFNGPLPRVERGVTTGSDNVVVADPREEEDDDSFLTSPVTWVVAGAVVAAIAGGVTAGVLLSKDPEPYAGTSGVLFSP